MKLVEKFVTMAMTTLGLRKPSATPVVKVAKRDRPKQHHNSREVERRLRQQAKRDAKKAL